MIVGQPGPLGDLVTRRAPIGHGAVSEGIETRELGGEPVGEGLERVLPVEATMERRPAAGDRLHGGHRRTSKHDEEWELPSVDLLQLSPFPDSVELGCNGRQPSLAVGEVLELVQHHDGGARRVAYGARRSEIHEQAKDGTPTGEVSRVQWFAAPGGQVLDQLPAVQLRCRPRCGEQEEVVGRPGMGE